MSDWQVGDLAVCVESGQVTREGVVYTVRQVIRVGHDYPEGGFYNYGPDDNLRFVGIFSPPGHSSGAERFRKIRPDEREACEPEFVTLLKRSRKTVRA